jgi:GDPmannose 4,6-dehydratase
LRHGDLTDQAAMDAVLREAEPHEVYNLGAQSHVKVSFELPIYTGNVTGLGALRLLESLHGMKTAARFYQASSSEIFGKAVETPQTETTPFLPAQSIRSGQGLCFLSDANLPGGLRHVRC